MPPKNLPLRLATLLAMPLLTLGVLVGPVVLPSALAATAGDSLDSSADTLSSSLARDNEPMRVERRVVMAPPAWVSPVEGYRLTGRFGDVSGLWSAAHTGLDLAAPSGTLIRSITDGVVTAAGYDGAYGYKTVVRLEDGTELWYAHQSTIAVAVGQRVSAGDPIGTVGTTGNVTGPHLHLEMRLGAESPVDPLAALAEHGLQL